MSQPKLHILSAPSCPVDELVRSMGLFFAQANEESITSTLRHESFGCTEGLHITCTP
jgi:hypothetical protein